MPNPYHPLPTPFTTNSNPSQTSKSFFDATKELQSIVTVLDATCAADLDFCTTYLHDQAAALTSPDNCGQEYDELQPDVRRVHLGLTSFNVLYKATCLRQDDTYCFANAITNASTPANAYVYFLPLNMPLPGSAAPACGVCLQDTMAIYQAATATRSLAIADTYEGAAGRLNAVCGGQFANETLPEAVDGGAEGRVAPSVFVMTAVVVFLSWVL
ncbi:hypothetical protein IMZ48_11025 [Candidatus Bathyarchaeota archaeon]|nr:hypothetical protein [Candidatus Bathyarchaeota archaeon]